MGILAFECLTGGTPFVSNDPSAPRSPVASLLSIFTNIGKPSSCGRQTWVCPGLSGRVSQDYQVPRAVANCFHARCKGLLSHTRVHARTQHKHMCMPMLFRPLFLSVCACCVFCTGSVAPAPLLCPLFSSFCQLVSRCKRPIVCKLNVLVR